MAICPNCGANVGFAKVCPHCGTVVVSNAPKQTSNIEQIKQTTNNFTQKPTCTEAEFKEMVVKFFANASEAEKNTYGARVRAYSENYRAGGTGIVNNPVKTEYARSGGDASNFSSGGTAVAAPVASSRGGRGGRSGGPNKRTIVILACALLGAAVVIGCAVGIPLAVRASKQRKQAVMTSKITLQVDYYDSYHGYSTSYIACTITRENGEYSAIPSYCLPNPRQGFNFVGYYDSPDGTGGTRYFDNYGYATRSWDYYGGNQILYAHWEASTITIYLSNNGGSGGQYSITATPGSYMPNIDSYNLPTRSGYTFMGYYDSQTGGGTQYIDANGYGCRYCDLSNGSYLYAQWQSSSSSISYNCLNTGSYGFTNVGSYWQSNNYGVSSSTAEITVTFYGSGYVEYEYRVSSESGCDRMYITHNSTTKVNGASGIVDWTTQSITVSYGDTLRIRYQKDSSVNSGDDRAYFRFTNI